MELSHGEKPAAGLCDFVFHSRSVEQLALDVLLAKGELA
jgi:hypothetical protein